MPMLYLNVRHTLPMIGIQAQKNTLDSSINQPRYEQETQQARAGRGFTQPKITIDSATMMNKGFEMIEAKWLFGVPAEKIQVLVHPQSIVHSAVQFRDGGVKAQLGIPDMHLPIQYAFSFPERLYIDSPRLDLFRQPLEFFEPDMEKFRCLAMAYEAINRGGNIPCVMNAANEVVNLAFRQNRCGFLDMGEIIEATMAQAMKSPRRVLGLSKFIF